MSTCIQSCIEGGAGTRFGALYGAWINKDCDAFEEALALASNKCKNIRYPSLKFDRIIDAAVRENAVVFVKFLIKANADFTSQNKGKAPIHIAVESESFEAMKMLIDARESVVNTPDNSGSTMLHYMVTKEWSSEEVSRKWWDYVLELEQLDLNLRNFKKFTPIHLAASEGRKDIIQMLLDKRKSDLNLDIICRESIQRKWPGLANNLPLPKDPVTTPQRLFELLLENDNDERFIEEFDIMIETSTQKSQDATNQTTNPMKILQEYFDGQNTYLQYCCRYGRTKAAIHLVNKGVDVNYTPHQTMRPVFLACMKGRHEILPSLLEKADFSPNDFGENVLHVTVKSVDATGKHFQCLQILLQNLERTKLDINAQDRKGNTPLHYAVKYGGKDCVTALLKHGAYIGTLNKLKKSPIAHMSASVLEDYLDSCITSTGDMDFANEYYLKINYNFLIPKCKQKRPDVNSVKIPLTEKSDCVDEWESVPECEPLLRMSNNPHLKKLLVHPVFTSFIMLKWQRVRIFYYVNLLYYFLFCLLLLSYILFGYRGPCPGALVNNTSDGTLIKDQQLKRVDSLPTEENVITLRSTNLTFNETMDEMPETDVGCQSDGVNIVVFMRVLLTILLMVLAAREIFQISMNWKKYFTDLENYMEIVLIIILTYTIFKDCNRQFPKSDPLSYICPQLNAVGILIALFELVLLVGKHPLQALNIEMFKIVSKNFIKFLAWYITLIIAFALAFYTLFRDCGSACEENPFNGEGLSIFKTIIMLTGEFDASNIPFTVYIGTSHLIFILFVFLIVIVLINLLNGLAVTDTQNIRNESYLYRCISLVKLISYIENMLLINTNTFKMLSFNHGCRDKEKKGLNLNCFEYLARRIVFFPGLLRDGAIYILPNQRHKITFVCPTNMRGEGAGCYEYLSGYYTDRITAKSAEEIVTKRTKNALKELELNDLRSNMKTCTESLEIMRENMEILMAEHINNLSGISKVNASSKMQQLAKVS